MIEVQGNLIDMAKAGNFDVIVHGQNCFCNMGAGIALVVSSLWPQALEADKATAMGDFNKLGNYTKATGFTRTSPVKTFTIVNAYTQFGCDATMGADRFRYTAFDLILQKLEYEFPTQRIGFPYIGMGLAGGDETTIKGMLRTFANNIEANGGNVTLVEYRDGAKKSHDHL